MLLFPNALISPELWHRRFGHLGHEASKNVINGSYATGVIKPPTPYPLTSRCIPCLIGKSPQTPYQNNAKWASKTGDLVLTPVDRFRLLRLRKRLISQSSSTTRQTLVLQRSCPTKTELSKPGKK